MQAISLRKESPCRFSFLRVWRFTPILPYINPPHPPPPPLSKFKRKGFFFRLRVYLCFVSHEQSRRSGCRRQRNGNGNADRHKLYCMDSYCCFHCQVEYHHLRRTRHRQRNCYLFLPGKYVCGGKKGNPDYCQPDLCRDSSGTPACSPQLLKGSSRE